MTLQVESGVLGTAWSAAPARVLSPRALHTSNASVAQRIRGLILLPLFVATRPPALLSLQERKRKSDRIRRLLAGSHVLDAPVPFAGLVTPLVPEVRERALVERRAREHEAVARVDLVEVRVLVLRVGRLVPRGGGDLAPELGERRDDEAGRVVLVEGLDLRDVALTDLGPVLDDDPAVLEVVHEDRLLDRVGIDAPWRRLRVVRAARWRERVVVHGLVRVVEVLGLEARELLLGARARADQAARGAAAAAPTERDDREHTAEEQDPESGRREHVQVRAPLAGRPRSRSLFRRLNRPARRRRSAGFLGQERRW